MKSDLKKDLSVLTTINELSLSRIQNKVNWCICDIVEKTVYNHENVAEIDLGFGTLVINITENEVKYKFIPSKSLEKNIVSTVVDEKNPLTFVLEDNLVNKITNIYKDLW